MTLEYEIEGVKTRIEEIEKGFYKAAVGSELLYRSPTISTDIQCENMIQKIDCERTVFCQLAEIDEEMEVVRAERMAALSCGVSHIVLETERLHHIPLKKRLVEVSLNDFQAIVLQKAYEALAQYSIWLADDMDRAIYGFTPAATEEFAVEKRFKDFIHEARSKLVMIVLDKIALALEHGDGVEKERELILLRAELREHLEEQIPYLLELEKTVAAALEEHPELTDFLQTAHLLRLLLQGMTVPPEKSQMGWIQKLLLLQLLDQKLGCKPVLNSEPGGSRTSIAFALRLALMQASQKYPFDKLLSLILETPLALRPFFQENLVRFDQWRPQPRDKPPAGAQLNPDFASFIE